jgi:AcrR family transcriptional regulator
MPTRRRNLERARTPRRAAATAPPPEAPPRPRGRPRGFDAEHALDAALETFRAHGYSGTSLDALCAATGLNRPSLYGAFGNKQALFEACVDRYWSRVRALFAEALRSTGTLRGDLRAFLAAHLDVIYGSPAAGCLVVCALPTEVEREPAFRPHLERVLAQADAALGARLEQARAAGELARDVSPARAAALIGTVVMGLSVRARAGAPRAELERIDRQLLDLVC